MTKERFKEIISYLSTVIRGTEFEDHVFAVGGCVRDLIMGNEIKDIDMCVDLPDGGVKFANWMKSNGYNQGSVVIYETYGTAMFCLKAFPDDEIEVVQTRGEQYHDKDSRNPQVTFAPIEEDCVRRDLTMNALYMNVSTEEVLDLTCKGREDIKNGVCRVTNDDPDIVFNDDPLRILRVIKFACRYNFFIEEKTSDSMKKFVDRLSIISQERITDEFSKMITSKNPCRAMELLRYYGAMKYVIPEVDDMVGLEQNEYHFGDVYEHTLGLLEHCLSNDLAVRVACVLHDVGKTKTQTRGEDGRVHFYDHEIVGSQMAYDICIRMRYPKDFAEEIAFYVKWHMYTKHWGNDIQKMKLKSLRKLEYICGTEERFRKLLQVIDADNKAHRSDHCLPDQVTHILGYVGIEQPDYEKMFAYKLPIDGYDVMQELGIGPGKEIKLYLDHCLRAAFQNPHITKEECIKKIKSDKIKGIE